MKFVWLTSWLTLLSVHNGALLLGKEFDVRSSLSFIESLNPCPSSHKRLTNSTCNMSDALGHTNFLGDYVFVLRFLLSKNQFHETDQWKAYIRQISDKFEEEMIQFGLVRCYETSSKALISLCQEKSFSSVYLHHQLGRVELEIEILKPEEDFSIMADVLKEALHLQLMHRLFSIGTSQDAVLTLRKPQKPVLLLDCDSMICYHFMKRVDPHFTLLHTWNKTGDSIHLLSPTRPSCYFGWSDNPDWWTSCVELTLDSNYLATTPWHTAACNLARALRGDGGQWLDSSALLAVLLCPLVVVTRTEQHTLSVQSANVVSLHLTRMQVTTVNETLKLKLPSWSEDDSGAILHSSWFPDLSGSFSSESLVHLLSAVTQRVDLRVRNAHLWSLPQIFIRHTLAPFYVRHDALYLANHEHVEAHPALIRNGSENVVLVETACEVSACWYVDSPEDYERLRQPETCHIPLTFFYMSWSAANKVALRQTVSTFQRMLPMYGTASSQSSHFLCLALVECFHWNVICQQPPPGISRYPTLSVLSTDEGHMSTQLYSGDYSWRDLHQFLVNYMKTHVNDDDGTDGNHNMVTDSVDLLLRTQDSSHNNKNNNSAMELTWSLWLELKERPNVNIFILFLYQWTEEPISLGQEDLRLTYLNMSSSWLANRLFHVFHCKRVPCLAMVESDEIHIWHPDLNQASIEDAVSRCMRMVDEDMDFDDDQQSSSTPRRHMSWVDAVPGPAFDFGYHYYRHYGLLDGDQQLPGDPSPASDAAGNQVDPSGMNSKKVEAVHMKTEL